jgi:hypothetical protein
VLPRTRSEDKWFRDWIQTNQPQWTEAIRLPGERIGDLPRVWSVFLSPLPSAEGYRIIWVHSTVKATRDEHARRSRIEAGAAAIDALNTRLAGPKTRLKTRAAVEQAAAPALVEAGAARWLQVSIGETVEESFRQENRGRPGTQTRYRRTTRSRYTVTWTTRDETIAYDAASDGCFPLVTNTRDLSETEVLVAYRYQPNLERHHHLLKSVQDADPIWLRDPARIEAIFCCQFLALLVGALIERQIRNAMHAANTNDIPLYPELRACEAPSAERILAVFADLTATNCATTAASCRPSKPNPPGSSNRSSTFSACPPAPTAQADRRQVGGHIRLGKCGTSDPRPDLRANRPAPCPTSRSNRQHGGVIGADVPWHTRRVA